MEVQKDLMIALEEREQTIHRLQQEQSRLEALLHLNRMTDAPLQAITDFALQESVRLTESDIGYLAFMNEDESVLTVHSWPKTAMECCAVIDKPVLYPIETTGLWGEAVRQRKPVITNDYACAAPNPLKKGPPDGHVAVTRHMNVPVFQGERIVAVAGVGNKPGPYDDWDVRQLSLLMQGMWDFIQRRSAQSDLRQSHDALEIRVRERTAELAGANEELKKERSLLHLLMDYLPHNIYFKDAQSRFLRINRAMARYFGLKDAALAVGKTDVDFFSSEHAEQALADEREILRTGQPILDKEEKETWPDGHTTWAATTKMPLFDESGRIVGTFGISRDITERKQAAEALQAAKEAAEAANRAKSTFLANMSHEIRTPLNAIIGMSDLVLDTALSRQQHEFLAAVRDSGEALLSVINDILDFSKIEAGHIVLDRAPFDLRESLGDTLKSFAVRAHQQGLELACSIHTDVPRMVLGDYNRLRQIIVNLVGNAIKFTDHGEVVVQVNVEREACRGLVEETQKGGEGETTTDSMTSPLHDAATPHLPHASSPPQSPSAPPSLASVLLHFIVSDTGVGIPKEKCGAIFEMFEQVDNSYTRRHGGTGLGLAIASRLVELMGGEIWVESELGHGSRFHFTVRLDRAGDAAPGPMLEPPSLHGLRVLVVDDNATNRRILEELLSNWRMVPVMARGAIEAMELLHRAHEEHEPYRLVLTDGHMPMTDGFMFAEQIKRDERLKSTIVMMLTSGDNPHDIARCQQLGIAAYLLKPIKQSELLQAIEVAVGLGIAADDKAEPAPAPRPSRRLRVLLAEDSLVNQQLAVGLLERQGHTVFVANHGKEAVAAYRSQKFDLILMDVQMPEMDGLEATMLIRAEERHTGRHTPIIAMTAHAMKGDRERCLEAGMDGYVAKPIRRGELAAAIKGLVDGHEESSSGGPTAASQAAPVDWSEALNSVQGNRTLLRTIVQAALEEFPRLMADIRAAVDEHDKTKLRIAAHTLKGSLRCLGANQAFDDAFRLEQMGHEGALGNAAEALEILQAGMDQVIPILSQYLLAGPEAGELAEEKPS